MKRMLCLLCVWVALLGMVSGVNASTPLPRVSLKVKNLSLVDVLEKLKQQIDFDFIYNEKVVGEIYNISLDVTDAPLDSVMTRMLKGTKLGYEITDKIIVIADKKNMSREVKGMVTDAGGKALEGVLVTIKEKARKVHSDAEGRFLIRVPYGCCLLRFSKSGMKMKEVKLSPGSRELEVKMEIQ